MNTWRILGAAVALLSSLFVYSQAVNIPDPWLQKSVREALGKSVGDITVEDMESLTSLSMRGPHSSDTEHKPIQTLAGIEKEPDNSFLWTRLGNLFRSCGQTTWASEWYEKTLQHKPTDIEARHHLYTFAIRSSDFPTALTHAQQLVRYLLEGQKSEKPELTKGIAGHLVATLLNAPEEFRTYFSRETLNTSQSRETVFIRSLLNAKGDEDAIIEDAVARLMNGIVEIDPSPSTTNHSKKSIKLAVDLIASLQEVVSAEGLDSEALELAVEVDDDEKIKVHEREWVPIHDGKKAVFWPAQTLRKMVAVHG